MKKGDRYLFLAPFLSVVCGEGMSQSPGENLPVPFFAAASWYRINPVDAIKGR